MNWHQTKPNRKTFRNPKPSSLEWHISNDEYCIFGNKKTRRTQPSQHNEMCISNSKYPSHERHSYRGCDLDRCIAHRLRIMMIKMMMMVAMIFPVIDYITFVFFSSRRFQLWSQNPLKNHANVRTVDRMSILKEKAQLTFYYYYFFFFVFWISLCHTQKQTTEPTHIRCYSVPPKCVTKRIYLKQNSELTEKKMKNVTFLPKRQTNDVTQTVRSVELRTCDAYLPQITHEIARIQKNVGEWMEKWPKMWK